MGRTIVETCVEAYIEGLGLARLEEVPDIWFTRPIHAELVREHCAGAIDHGSVVAAAAKIGAPWQTTDQVRAVAETEARKLLADIEAKRQAGALKKLNADYKSYRLQQIAKTEKAVPYSKFFASFACNMARLAAAAQRISAE